MDPETLNQITEGRKREFTDAWIDEQLEEAEQQLPWPDEEEKFQHIDWCSAKGDYLSYGCDCPCPCEALDDPEGCPIHPPAGFEEQVDEKAKDYHLAVLQEVAELTKRKRAGYAPGADPFANFRMSTMFGVDPLDGIFVRMTDKMSRVASLRTNPANDQVNESLRETLLDLGNYAFIGVAYMDEQANARRS